MQAAANGYINVRELLVQHQSRLHITDETCQTAVHIAIHNRQTPVLSILLRTPTDDSSPIGKHVFDTLVYREKKARFDAFDKPHQTPLHLAALYNLISVVNILLNSHDNVNIVDQGGVLLFYLQSNKDTRI